MTTIKTTSLLRECAGAAPLCGFSLPGSQPAVFERKRLKAVITTLPDQVRESLKAHINGDGSLVVTWERGRYVFYCQARIAAKADRGAAWRGARRKLLVQQTAWSGRRRVSAIKSAWKRVVWHDEEIDETGAGGKHERWERAGLSVFLTERGNYSITHMASGLALGFVTSKSAAFVAADKVLSRYPDWTQDAESVKAMVGQDGAAFIRYAMHPEWGEYRAPAALAEAA